MKIVFSTKNVCRTSFSGLCHLAKAYGCAGFEIYDAVREQAEHADSIFYTQKSAESMRRLFSRKLSVAALCFPTPIEAPTVSAEDLVRYVRWSREAFCDAVIVRVEQPTEPAALAQKLMPALRIAEQTAVEILLETAGYFADTKKLIAAVNGISSVALGAAWNVRETYFTAHETAEQTIEILGAYIRYVRLGDRRDGRNVMLGEGDLPLGEFSDALQSLNYDGFVCADWNEDITDPDIVLTHFVTTVSALQKNRVTHRPQYLNRAGTGSFPLPKYEVVEATFGSMLDTVANAYPDQLAFKYTTLDYTRTYAEFRRDVDAVAAALCACGVRPGYHVAVWATNVPEWFLTFWAATKIGAVLVTVNTAYKIHEIEYLLHQADVHTLVMIENCRDIRYGEIVAELCPELAEKSPADPLSCARLPFLRQVITVGFEMPGCLSWNAFLATGDRISPAEVAHRAALVRPDDVANIQYTSGTTGFPKGVMLTHRNIINNGKIIGDRMDLSTADRMMIQVPMFHCFGMVLSMTSTMTHGGTLCPLPYFSAKSSLSCIHNEKITCFNGVPTMFIAMFAHSDFAKTDFSQMRTGIMAGANCPPELMRRAAAEMNMTEIVSVYGQTEASPGCTMGEVHEDLAHRVETVGSAFPGVECKIINPETGEDLPDGENGEFVARGFNIMKGYYKMPHATRNTIDRDGWLHSGDICCRTPDGYYKVTGRLKDMIIRGGENIYPREIEEFYLTHEKIRDVQVIAVKDEKYGEEACAFIRLKEGCSADEQELRAFGQASIAAHKVPRYFIFAEQFPMNAAGKILKYKMREIAEQQLKIQ